MFCNEVHMKVPLILFITFAVLIMAAALLSMIYLKWLRVIHVTIKDAKIQKEHRLVLISDLHNSEYGRENRKLSELIIRQNPEFVLAAGDLLVDTAEETAAALHLLETLTAAGITVIYVPGNHEIKYRTRFPQMWNDYLRKLKSMGVIFLDDASYETEDICFSGYTNKQEQFRKFRKLYPLTVLEMREQLPAYQGSKCNFLVTHHPDFFEVYREWGADRIVAGHLHGGIVRLPFVGGILSPQTFFAPKYDLGTYYKGKTTMTVSAGLGVHTIPLRIFNRPDITVIDLVRAD